MSFQCTAPNKLQRDVVNFIDDSVLNEQLNVTVEAALNQALEVIAVKSAKCLSTITYP
jgi:enhancing lycopene biosynthesis protein 2